MMMMFDTRRQVASYKALASVLSYAKSGFFLRDLSLEGLNSTFERRYSTQLTVQMHVNTLATSLENALRHDCFLILDYGLTRTNASFRACQE